VYLCQENAGRAAARNAGVAAADGDVILFVDDDRIADLELVAGHLKAQSAESECVVVGWKMRCLTRWRRDVLPMQESDFSAPCRASSTVVSRMAVEEFP